MINVKNYWEETSPSVKRLILWLKGIIGLVSVSSFIQGDPRFSFWFLIAGIVIDGLLQLLPPDTIVKAGTKAVCLFICFIATTASLTGCFSKRSVVEHSVTDTTTTNYKQVAYAYKGAKVVAGLNMDSLYHAALIDKDQRLEDSVTNLKIENKYKQDSIAALKAGHPVPAAPVLIQPKPDVKYVTDPQSKAQLTYWIDQYGKLQVGCESKDQTLQLMVAQVTKLRTELDKKVTTITVTAIPKWIWFLLIPSILLNILLIFFPAIKKALNIV
jgi:hypothetical protein